MALEPRNENREVRVSQRQCQNGRADDRHGRNVERIPERAEKQIGSCEVDEVRERERRSAFLAEGDPGNRRHRPDQKDEEEQKNDRTGPPLPEARPGSHPRRDGSVVGVVQPNRSHRTIGLFCEFRRFGSLGSRRTIVLLGERGPLLLQLGLARAFLRFPTGERTLISAEDAWSSPTGIAVISVTASCRSALPCELGFFTKAAVASWIALAVSFRSASWNVMGLVEQCIHRIGARFGLLDVELDHRVQARVGEGVWISGRSLIVCGRIDRQAPDAGIEQQILPGGREQKIHKSFGAGLVGCVGHDTDIGRHDRGDAGINEFDGEARRLRREREEIDDNPVPT